MFAMTVIFLFVAVWFSIVNLCKLFVENGVPAINIIIQAVGITGFAVLQWLVK